MSLDQILNIVRVYFDMVVYPADALQKSYRARSAIRSCSQETLPCQCSLDHPPTLGIWGLVLD